ncbi:hypothetical protein GE09DRAFT_1219234 [Coniochaeta sp. 2T2.1]|nr:hypothetical protein GE09DRAFT_1219234 [Coniochaeta sp. 2T2.1]
MLSRRAYHARHHRPAASPSAADRILDDAFLTFLLTHVNSPTINPNLRSLLTNAGIQVPYRPGQAGDDLVAAQNEVFFHTPAESLRACMPDGSEVKRELRRYPKAFARIWPDEEPVSESVVDEDEEVSDTDPETTRTPGSSRRAAGWLAGGVSKRKREGFENPVPDAAGPSNVPVRMILTPGTGMSRAETGSKRPRLREPRAQPSGGAVEAAADANVEEGLPSAKPLGEGDAGELGDGKVREKYVFQGISIREAPRDPTLWRDLEGPVVMLDEPKTKETEREMQEKEKEKLREAQMGREIIELFEQQMEVDEERLEEITLEKNSGRLRQDKEEGEEAHEDVHAAEDEVHTIVLPPVGQLPERQDNHDNEIKDTTPRTSPPPEQSSENVGQSNNNPFAAARGQVIIPKKYKYAPSPPPFPPLSPDIKPDYTVPLPPVEMVDDDELLRGATAVDRESWEWIREMDYEGTPQPPLAVRLEHILNFLREEDPDRLLEFETKLQEAQDFVAWLEHGEGRELMNRANQAVRNMFFDVQRKITGHRHFQGVMFGVVPPGKGIKSVDEVPKPTRGKRPVIPGARAIQIGEQQEPDDGPRRLLVAPAHRVHTQFVPMDRRQKTPTGEAAAFLNQLREAENAFWTWEDHDDPDKSYLYRLENAAYDTLTAKNGPLARYKTKQGQLILPTDDKLPLRQVGGEIGPPGSVERQAVERGARRAALQQALRHFTNSEQTLAGSRYNRVVPAVEGKVLDEVRADVDRNHQWDLPKLSRRPVPKNKLETMPYTVWWREQKKVLADLALNVRRLVEEQHSEARGWVTLPMGVINGGPFVWRGVDPDVQKDQDLLKECEEVFRAIVRAPRVPTARHPKPLLDEIQRLALRPAVIELLEAGRWEKFITPDGIRWLRFLAGNSVSEEMLAAAAAAKGKQQPKLYGIFAARLQKAIDDRSEAGLFPDTEKWVSVEELLAVINRGCGGDRGKVAFSPPQAMYFLERAVKQGICRYTPDPTAHGHIARSIRPIEPLDRVAGTIDYTTDGANPLLQATFPTDITSFLSLPEPDSDPDIAREEALIRSRFFRQLGKRLGLTLHRILQRKHGWHKAHPLPTLQVQKALYTYREAYKTIRDKTDEEWKGQRDKPPLTLAGFVEGFDPEWWAGWLPTVLGKVPDEMRTPENEAEAKEEAAMELIRHRILLESHENQSLLGRGRQAIYTKADGSKQTVWVRDFNWDWAAEEARGKKRRFFSLDRWPLELQSEKTRSRIRRDEDVDRDMVSDPVTEDPVPREYYFREKLRPYEEERVESIRGPAEYLLGDTRLQRRKVEREMREMIEGVDPDAERQKPKTWKETLASLTGPRRSPSPLDGGWVETSLPEVDPKMVPKSWTPPPEYFRGQPAVEDSAMEEGAEVADSVEGEDDDVPMMDLRG